MSGAPKNAQRIPDSRDRLPVGFGGKCFSLRAVYGSYLAEAKNGEQLRLRRAPRHHF